MSGTKKIDRTKSRVTNGLAVLGDGRTMWGRLVRDTAQGLEAHLGGEPTEVERLTIRRIAALEAELVCMEAEFAKLRGNGEAPSASVLDLYSRLSNTQRRHLEAIGMSRRPKDATPDLRDYIEAKR